MITRVPPSTAGTPEPLPEALQGLGPIPPRAPGACAAGCFSSLAGLATFRAIDPATSGPEAPERDRVR